MVIYKFFTFMAVVIWCLSVDAYNKVPDVYFERPSSSVTHYYTSVMTQTITAQDIQKSGATTLATVLQSVSLVQLHQLYAGSAIVPSLRGFGDDATGNTLILINGVPLTNPDTSAVILDAIPLETIKSIHIISGSAGVLYGDQAVGGVINIITKPIFKQHYNVSLLLGSYSLRQLTSIFSSRIRHHLSISLLAKKMGARNYREHNKEQHSLLDGNIKYHYASGFVRLHYNFFDSDLEYPGALTLEQLNQNRRQAQNMTDFNNEIHHAANLRWQHDFTANWVLEQNILWQNMSGHGVLTTPFTESRKLVEVAPKLYGKISMGSKVIQNQSGLLYQYAIYKLAGTTYFSHSSQSRQAVYAQFTYPLSKTVKIYWGGRLALAQVDLANQSFLNHSHYLARILSFGLRWSMSRHLNYFMRRAGSYRFPKAEENALTQNNKPLNAQLGTSYELGLSWHNRYASSDLSLYLLNLNNEIMYVPSLTGPLGTNENLPPTRREGINVKFNYAFSSRLIGHLGYSYVNARFSSGVNQGKQIPFVSAHKLSLSCNYAITQRWNLHSEIIYVGQRYPLSDVANVGQILPGYAVANVSMSYQYKQIALTVSVNNLTNTLYNYSAQTVYNSVNQTATTFYYPAPGRTFNIKFNWFFDK